MKTSPHPEWALEHKKPGTELRKINGRYYLYEVSSKWDSDKKRAKKVTGKLLGKITEEKGFVESDKNKLRRTFKPTTSLSLPIKEYGASWFVCESFQDDIELLKKTFPDIWEEVVSLSFIRLMYNTPIKNTQFRFDASYLSQIFPEISLGEKRVSALYRKIGSERESVVAYMKNFINDQDHIMFDGTNLVSHSQKIEAAKIGYNSKQDYDPQLNILFLFSSELKSPVFYRLLPGNIRDVKAFKLTIQEAGISKAVVIADKGFYSKDNIETLENLDLKFVIPLRRNNPAIDYSPMKIPDNSEFDGYFEYQKRFVWHRKQTIDGMDIYLFYDPYLRQKEENDYLTRIGTHPEKYSLNGFREKSEGFGTLSFISNIKDQTSEQVYKIYKTRNEIETMIDAMKNVLEMDHSYMQNEIALQGWMFIGFLALRWYYRIYMMLKENKKTKNIAPKDLLMHLAEIKKIKMDGMWVTSEITTRTQKLMEKLMIHIT